MSSPRAPPPPPLGHRNFSPSTALLLLLLHRFVSSENLLRSLGSAGKLSWTVLRGGYFMSNTLLAFPAAVKAKGAISGVDGVCMPIVDPQDIGRAAARVLADLGSGHEGKVYEMSGPAHLTVRDYAAVMAKARGGGALVPCGRAVCAYACLCACMRA